MSGLLNNQNRRYLEKKMREKEGNAYSTLSSYVEAKENGSVLSIRFDYADADGNLSVTDTEGVVIALSASNFQAGVSYYNERIKAHFLALDVACVVDSIDEVNKVVYVKPFSGAFDMSKALQAEIGKAVARRDKALEKGEEAEPVLVWGTIRKISANGREAFVDILSQGIQGKISVAAWQTSYLRDLRAVCVENGVYQFEVIRRKDHSKYSTWILSREKITPNPWEVVKQDGIRVNDVMVIKVLDKPEGKSYLWGVSPRYKGIEIMMDYNSNISLAVGISYKCKVKAIDVDNKIFKVVPFAVADEREEVVRLLSSPKKK